MPHACAQPLLIRARSTWVLFSCHPAGESGVKRAVTFSPS
jgi:hypothetical protein